MRTHDIPKLYSEYAWPGSVKGVRTMPSSGSPEPPVLYGNDVSLRSQARAAVSARRTVRRQNS